MRIQLSNGMLHFYQWDTGQQVKAPDGVETIHFRIDKDHAAQITVVNGWATVPDECFQSGDDLVYYAYDENHTTDSARVEVVNRPKPEGYAYTPTEVKTWESLDARIKALENGGGVAGVSSINGQTGAVEITAKGLGALTEDDLQSATNAALAQAKASGEFDGAPGPNGANGKSAYQYAIDGGYTGTEAEFAAKLAEEKPTGVSELYPFCRKFNQIAYSYVAGGGGTNSKEHFLHCAQNNYDSIKTDLRLTSDGALVCCHDEGFTFNSDGKITTFDSSNCTLIHDMTYAEVMALEFNTMYNGSRCHTSDLDYVLQVCKAYGKLAYITIREEYIETTAELVVSALKKWGMLGNCIINSFSNDALMAVRAIAPEVYLSFVFSPYTESGRTLALTNANANERYMLCLYYSLGHTISDLTGDSGVLDFIRQCQSNGIVLYGAQEELGAVGDADALLSLGFGGVQTKLARPAPSGDLDISEMSMSVSVENTSNVLTISDGIGNSKTVTLPDASLTDEQADSAISEWMEKNAATKTFSPKNVYNPNDVNVADGYLASAGQVNSSADYWTTGFIPASPGDVVTPSKDGAKCNCYYRAAYNSSKTFISRESGNKQTYTIPDGASYFRVSFKNSTALKTDNVMLTINNSDLTYEAYFEPYEQAGLSDYFILVSPSGTKYKLSVSDNGTISTVAV